MGIFLNPGNEAFSMAVNSQIYVDKTGLIEETNKLINTERRFVCISRPRRFGKSIAANMLVAYYGKGVDSSAIFNELKISTAKDYLKHMNQYDVIRIDMQRFLRETGTGKEFIDKIETEVKNELKTIYKDNLQDVDGSLPEIFETIYSQGKNKFIFIIDEWDCLLRRKTYSDDDQILYLDFIRDLLKNREYVALAYMTGILPIKKYGEHSALNMFREYSMTNPGAFAEYVGFTEREVEILCNGDKDLFEDLKLWYDGYLFKNAGHIYNPNSVVEAILEQDLANYWTNTETYEALKLYLDLNYDGLRDSIIDMLSGARIKISIKKFQNDMTTFSSKDDVLTLLVHLGYLAYDKDTAEVYIPNYEIIGEFESSIDGPMWSDVANAIRESQKLLEATWNMDIKTVESQIEKIHSQYTSIIKYNDENSLTCALSIAYYNAINFYTRFYELPSGKGYADIAFLPKRGIDKPALLIELKYDKNVQTAITQIKDNNYPEKLKDYEGNLLLVGINYDKKTKKHECVIERV